MKTTFDFNFEQYSRQAGQNCTTLEKLGLFVYVFLKTSYFSSASFVYFFIFWLHFRGEISFYLSDHLVLMCTPTKCLLNICQNRSFKQTPADRSVCLLYELAECLLSIFVYDFILSFQTAWIHIDMEPKRSCQFKASLFLRVNL